MADNSTQTGADTIATDDVTTLNGGASSGVKVERIKVGYGDDGTYRDVSPTFPLPVMGPDASASGTISATDAVLGVHANDGAVKTGTPTANSYVALALGGGESAFVLRLSGTFGGGTVWVEVSPDSTNGVDGGWISALTRQSGTSSSTLDESITAAGIYRGNASGMTYVRLRITGATTPSVAVVLRASDGTGAVFLNAALPSGSNTVGSVNLASSQGSVGTTAGTLSAAGTNTPGTQSTASTTGQVVASVSTAGNATFHIVAAAFVGTLIFEGSIDGGFNYAPVMAIREDGTGADSSTAISTAVAFIRTYTVGVPGFTHFRVRVAAFTSGTAAVLIAQGPFLIETSPSLAAGAATIGAVSHNPALTTGVASGNVFTGRVAATALTTGTQIVAAPAAGLSIYVTDFSVSNMGAALTLVSLLPNAGTAVLDLAAAATGGGGTVNLQTPWKLAAATALHYAMTVASTTVYINVSGYIAP